MLHETYFRCFLQGYFPTLQAFRYNAKDPVLIGNYELF